MTGELGARRRLDAQAPMPLSCRPLCVTASAVGILSSLLRSMSAWRWERFAQCRLVACTGTVCQQGESDTFANQTKLIKMLEELPKLSEQVQPFVVMAAFTDWPYCNVFPNWTA